MNEVPLFNLAIGLDLLTLFPHDALEQWLIPGGQLFLEQRDVQMKTTRIKFT